MNQWLRLPLHNFLSRTNSAVSASLCRCDKRPALGKSRLVPRLEHPNVSNHTSKSLSQEVFGRAALPCVRSDRRGRESSGSDGTSGSQHQSTPVSYWKGHLWLKQLGFDSAEGQ